MIYTSTDSLVIPKSDVPKMVDYIDEYKLGCFKCEAQTDDESVFVGRGLYYINEKKYGTLNVPHACIEHYCSQHSLTLLEFYKQLARGKAFTNMKYEGAVYKLSRDSYKEITRQKTGWIPIPIVQDRKSVV